jgi:Glucodextranase, domain B
VKIFILLVFLLATACAPAPLVTEDQVARNTETQPAAPVELPAAQTSALQNTSSPQHTLPETTPVAPPGTSAALWVKILTPEDGATVTTQAVKITGQAPPETVITINDEILVVPQDQSFEVEVLLQEGPNLIDIVASDLSGNELYIPLTVFYEP